MTSHLQWKAEGTNDSFENLVIDLMVDANVRTPSPSSDIIKVNHHTSEILVTLECGTMSRFCP